MNANYISTEPYQTRIYMDSLSLSYIYWISSPKHKLHKKSTKKSTKFLNININKKKPKKLRSRNKPSSKP